MVPSIAPITHVYLHSVISLLDILTVSVILTNMQRLVMFMHLSDYFQGPAHATDPVYTIHTEARLCIGVVSYSAGINGAACSCVPSLLDLPQYNTSFFDDCEIT